MKRSAVIVVVALEIAAFLVLGVLFASLGFGHLTKRDGTGTPAVETNVTTLLSVNQSRALVDEGSRSLIPDPIGGLTCNLMCPIVWAIVESHGCSRYYPNSCIELIRKVVDDLIEKIAYLACNCITSYEICTEPTFQLEDSCSTNCNNAYLQDGKCVQCIDDTDCPSSKPICSPSDYICISCATDGYTCDSGLKCDSSSGQCEQCIHNSDCLDSSLPSCYDGECGPCNPPTHLCPEGTMCQKGTGMCVQCLNDTDCPSSKPICSPSDYICISCATDGYTCDSGLKCDSSSGQCEQCIHNSDCLDSSLPSCYDGECGPCNRITHLCAEGYWCQDETGKCLECLVGSHCSSRAPYCNVDTGNCGRCGGDDDCPFGLFCDSMSGSCVTCLTDSHCVASGLMNCDVKNSKCFNCSEDIPCSCPNDLCDYSSGKCVECVGTGQSAYCPSAYPYCNGENRCVQCLFDLNCQGACSAEGNCICQSNWDCPETVPKCDLVTGLCGPCKEHSDCSSYDGLYYCGTSGVCVECEDDDDCGLFGTCAYGTCYRLCDPDSTSKEVGYCGKYQYCINNLCTECTKNDQCLNNGYCSGGSCKCSYHFDCPSWTPNCDWGSGNCYICEVDSDCEYGQTCEKETGMCKCQTNTDCPPWCPRCDGAKLQCKA